MADKTAIELTTKTRQSLKKKMRLALLADRNDLGGPEVAIFKFKPKEGALFSFVAGQYATLGLDVHGEFIARAYSIASSPYDREYLEFYINLVEEGQLTPALFKLRIGDEIYYMGPKGVFTLVKTTATNLLLVATGTGLAPYMSMLRTLHADQCSGKPHAKTITLLHGVRYSADLGYREELEALASEKDFNLRYIPMVSRTEQDPDWTPQVGKGRVTHFLEIISEGITPQSRQVLPGGLDPQELFSRLPFRSTAVYLCGNPDMITDAKALLKDKGYSEFHTEVYW